MHHGLWASVLVKKKKGYSFFIEFLFIWLGKFVVILWRVGWFINCEGYRGDISLERWQWRCIVCCRWYHQAWYWYHISAPCGIESTVNYTGYTLLVFFFKECTDNDVELMYNAGTIQDFDIGTLVQYQNRNIVLIEYYLYQENYFYIFFHWCCVTALLDWILFNIIMLVLEAFYLSNMEF